MSGTKSLVLAAVSLAVLASGAAGQPAREADEVEAVAKEFLKAFAAADAQKMKPYFADKVFIVGTPANRTAPPEKRVQSTWVTPDEVTKLYVKLFEEFGREKWARLVGRARPTLRQATKDGEHWDTTEAGDHVYNLNIRDSVKGKRPNLDEAILFVFRKVGRTYRIVGHYADYR